MKKYVLQFHVIIKNATLKNALNIYYYKDVKNIWWK